MYFYSSCFMVAQRSSENNGIRENRGQLILVIKKSIGGRDVTVNWINWVKKVLLLT